MKKEGSKPYMKNKIFTLLSTLLLVSASGCSVKAPEIINYGIDKDGNLIAYYDNGTTEVMDNFNDEIADGVNSIDISEDGYYIINGIKTNIPFDVTDVEISEDGYYIINGVKTNIKATDVWTVSFDTGFSQTIEAQYIFDGDKVIRPEINREGYTLIGWFCNDEEWRFNSDVVLNDMTLEARWSANEYVVSFNTNLPSVSLEPLTVTFDQDYQLPTLTNEGYTFSGWKYEDQILEMEGKWNIASDVTLDAIWNANEYVVTLNPNGGSVSVTSVSVTYGQDYSLPVPTNDFGVFKGWFYNNEKITDELGNSLEPWTFTQNITVTTQWIEEISTVEDLRKIDDALNGYYILTNDISLKNIEWTPLASNAPFTGVLLGNGFTIKNLTITNSHQYVGLFGRNGGIISDLRLENVDINLSNIKSDVYVGSICGENSGCITNVETSGNVNVPSHSSSYNSYVGGVVGRVVDSSFYSPICRVINNCNVTGPKIVGGIAALVTDESYSSFDYLKNNGNVTSDYVAGGILGSATAKSEFHSCLNTGVISSSSYCGGIVAMSPINSSDMDINRKITFDKCGNEGKIISSSSANNIGAGGIIGSAFNVSCTDVYNNADVEGSLSGGLVGIANYAVTILRSYSNGNIEGVIYAGGLYGLASIATISDSVVFGNISANISNSIAGSAIVYTPTLNNCHYNCYAEDYLGEETDYTYEKEFYINTLFWDEQDWCFYEDAYPTLNIDFDFMQS